MALTAFMQRARGALEERIRGCGEDHSKFYQPVTMKDSPDRYAVTVILRVMGIEGHANEESPIPYQEAWLTASSRDRGEICRLELSAQFLDGWECIGDREAGERLYQKSGTGIIIGFDEDGTATMIYQEQNRENPFTNAEYLGHITMLFDEMIALENTGRGQ